METRVPEGGDQSSAITFWQDDRVVTEWLRRRGGRDDPNFVQEEPVVMEFAGDLGGRRVADLGCGDGRFGVQALTAGCGRYVGVDGALTMVRRARLLLADARAEVRHEPIEQWRPEPGAFDLVVSRMALHYVEDLEPVLRTVSRSLTPAGRFVFSVEHPVITSCYRSATADDFPRSWTVDDYFIGGRRTVTWLGATVAKYHRPLEGYLDLLSRVGLRLDRLGECRPRPERCPDEGFLRDRQRVPMYLVVSASPVGGGETCTGS
jgi:SAM-dependent methyltransferase